MSQLPGMMDACQTEDVLFILFFNLISIDSKS